MTVAQLKLPRPEQGAPVSEWARAYASLGWHVFPVYPDKRPATPGGWHDATTEVGRFNWANKLVGVAAQPSGVMCIDIDQKYDSGGRWRDGTRWIEAMESLHGDIPRNVEAVTGSGGQHIIVQAPPGAPVMLVGGNGFPDVDLIGNGYFIVEPSTSNAGDYYWVDGSSPFEDDAPPCPVWLVEQVEKYTRTVQSKAARGPERVWKVDELANDSDEVAMIESALEALDAGMERAPWVQIGMAIHAKSGGSAFGRDVWDEWSRKSAKYPGPIEIEKQWNSFDPWGGTTLGTIFAMAEAAGWTRDGFELEQKIEAAEACDPEWVDLFNRAIEALGQYGPERPQRLPQEVGNGASLLAKDFPPTDWLIQGLLTKEAVFVIGGEPKTSKTWAGLEVLISCLTGLRCFNEMPAERVDRPVFAFLAEDQERSLRNRLRSLSSGKGCDPRPWASRFLYQSLKSVDLASLESTAALVADVWKAAPGGISILYLDPLRDLHRAEENDSGAMAEVMGRLRALRSVLGCAVVFVHHSHKASQSTNGRRAGQGLRGSSAIHGAVDGGLYLSGLKKNHDETEFENQASVELKALRGAGSFTLTLAIQDSPGGEAERADWDFSRRQRAPEGASDAELKVSAAVARLRMRPDGERMTITEVVNASGVSRSTAQTYMKKKVQSGELLVNDRGHYAPNERWDGGQ